jgi:hypothetical protein
LRRTEIIDRERRWARPAAIAAFGVLVLFVISVVLQSGTDLGSADTEAETLRAYDADAGTMIVSAILNALAFALLAPVLAYLFKAAEARSDRMRGALIGIVIAGPLFLAAALVLQAFALDSISSDFVATDGAACPDAQSTEDQDQCVEDLIADDSLAQVSSGLQLAGSLGLVVGVVYTSLWAMRVGLLTRFLGTLGMAVGVASLLFGPVFLILFALALGFLFLGLVPGGKPPAWEAGEAIPWPAPGERPSTTPGRDEEPVEGRAEEVFPDAAGGTDEEEPEERPREAPEAGSIADEVERASERPQKRKRRQ